MTCITRRTATRLAIASVIGLSLAPPALAKTEAELCRQYLAVVEDAVAVFEPLWTDDPRIEEAGYFDFSRYDTWEPKWYPAEITVCGNGMVAFCYAVLLGESDRATFTDRNIPRETLRAHAVQAVRWCCLTSDYASGSFPFPIPDGYPRRIRNERWIRPIGHRTDVMGWLTVAAARLWPDLDAETRKLVEEVFVGAAAEQRQHYTWSRPQGGNHDVVKQDLASTMGAAFLVPPRPDGPNYYDVVTGNGIDLVSTVQDQANPTKAAGQPVRKWAQGWNLYPDYTGDHHGWSQIWYGSDLIFEGRFYLELLSRWTGKDVPETFTYPGNGFDGVCQRIEELCLPEGEPASVHGMEYDAYYGAGLLAYCYGATIKQDPAAAALEERAANLLVRHNRAVRLYDYHRNSWAKAAVAYLIHKYAGPRAEPLPFAQAWARLGGTFHYPWQQTLIARSDDRWTSFSWGSISSDKQPGPVGFVVPSRNLDEPVEPLIYLHERSLGGTITVADPEETASADKKTSAKNAPAGDVSEPVYRWSRDDAGFTTAGVIRDERLDRRYAYFSLDDGPCVMLTVLQATQPCRFAWTGLPLYFYARPELTSARRYVDAQGELLLGGKANRQSDWWNVNDTLGLITVGGNGGIAIQRSTGSNWARTHAYRDKCDGVYVCPVDTTSLSPAEPAVDLAVAIYPNASAKQTEQAADMLGSMDPLVLPAGWKGCVIPDAKNPGRRFLVAANLAGTQTSAVVSLSFPEGAPVGCSPTTVSGRTGRLTLRLDPLQTAGQTFELYAETMDGPGVVACRDSDGRYRFEPLGPEPVRLRLRSATPTGHLRVMEGARPTRVDDQGLELVVDRPVNVTLGPNKGDHTGPAVEITDLDIREDGLATVHVTAADRSGLQAVELRCDDRPLGICHRPPFVWTCRPKPGVHTFEALATDRATPANTRASTRQTIVVPSAGGAP